MFFLIFIFFIYFVFFFFNEKFLTFFVYYYFNNDFLSFFKFLNIYFFRECLVSKALSLTNLQEQLNILKNIKNLQYKTTYNKLKKNAV